MAVPGTPNPKNPVRVGMLLPFNKNSTMTERDQVAICKIANTWAGHVCASIIVLKLMVSGQQI